MLIEIIQTMQIVLTIYNIIVSLVHMKLNHYDIDDRNDSNNGNTNHRNENNTIHDNIDNHGNTNMCK